MRKEALAPRDKAGKALPVEMASLDSLPVDMAGIAESIRAGVGGLLAGDPVAGLRALKICYHFRIAPPWALVAWLGAAAEDRISADSRTMDEALGLPTRKKLRVLRKLQIESNFRQLVYLECEAEAQRRRDANLPDGRGEDLWLAVTKSLRDNGFPVHRGNVERMDLELRRSLGLAPPPRAKPSKPAKPAK